MFRGFRRGRNRQGPRMRDYGEAGGGRMGGNRMGAGPGGFCICPSCGTTMPHTVGSPCYLHACPKCGNSMVRG